MNTDELDTRKRLWSNSLPCSQFSVDPSNYRSVSPIFTFNMSYYTIWATTFSNTMESLPVVFFWRFFWGVGLITLHTAAGSLFNTHRLSYWGQLSVHQWINIFIYLQQSSWYESQNKALLSRWKKQRFMRRWWSPLVSDMWPYMPTATENQRQQLGRQRCGACEVRRNNRRWDVFLVIGCVSPEQLCWPCISNWEQSLGKDASFGLFFWNMER